MNIYGNISDPNRVQEKYIRDTVNKDFANLGKTNNVDVNNGYIGDLKKNIFKLIDKYIKKRDEAPDGILSENDEESLDTELGKLYDNFEDYLKHNDPISNKNKNKSSLTPEVVKEKLGNILEQKEQNRINEGCKQ